MRLFFQDEHMARIWSAFIVSVFAVICVCLIKVILDKTPERVRRRQDLRGVTHWELVDMELQQHAEEEEEEEVEDAENDNNNSVEDLLATESSEAKVSTGARVRRAIDHDSIDQLMMTIVKGFSVLVGLVWDIAFEAAESVIVAPGAVSGHGPFKFIGVKLTEHPVAAKCVLCVLLVACVFPVWRKHIVPYSRRRWEQHFQDIKREEQRNRED